MSTSSTSVPTGVELSSLGSQSDYLDESAVHPDEVEAPPAAEDTSYLPPEPLAPLPADLTDPLVKFCAEDGLHLEDDEFWHTALDQLDWLLFESNGGPIRTSVLKKQIADATAKADGKPQEVNIADVNGMLYNYFSHLVINAPKTKNFYHLILNITRKLEEFLAHARSLINSHSSNNNQAITAIYKYLSTETPSWLLCLLSLFRLILTHVYVHLSYPQQQYFFDHIREIDGEYEVRKKQEEERKKKKGNTLASADASISLALQDGVVQFEKHGHVDLITRYVTVCLHLINIIPLPSHGSSQASTPPEILLEIYNTFFLALSAQMYFPIQKSKLVDEEEDSAEAEEHKAAPMEFDVLAQAMSAPTSLAATAKTANSAKQEAALIIGTLLNQYCTILPSDYQKILSSRYYTPSFFRKVLSSVSTLLFFPYYGLKYLFSLPASSPLQDRCATLFLLLTYQSRESLYRDGLRSLTNISDAELEKLSSRNSPVHTPSSQISFSKLFYALCVNIQKDHALLVLYTMLYENKAFKAWLLPAEKPAADKSSSSSSSSSSTTTFPPLEHLILPMLEIINREVDISRHQVYMMINVLIVLTSEHNFIERSEKIIIPNQLKWFEETDLSGLSLRRIIQIVLLKVIQKNLDNKLDKPHIFNNVFAAFCNLTFTFPASFQSSSTRFSPIPHPLVSTRLVKLWASLQSILADKQQVYDDLVEERSERVQASIQQERDLYERTNGEEGGIYQEEDFEDEADEKINKIVDEIETSKEFVLLVTEALNYSLSVVNNTSPSITDCAQGASLLLELALIQSTVAPYFVSTAAVADDIKVLLENINKAIKFTTETLKKKERDIASDFDGNVKAVSAALTSGSFLSTGCDFSSLQPRGSFVYSEQTHSETFFLPYIYSIAGKSPLNILPCLVDPLKSDVEEAQNMYDPSALFDYDEMYYNEEAEGEEEEEHVEDEKTQQKVRIAINK